MEALLGFHVRVLGLHNILGGFRHHRCRSLRRHIHSRPSGPYCARQLVCKVVGVFPAIGVLALAAILVSPRWQHDRLMAGVFFVAALLSLAVMFWPHMISSSITLANAAAPD